ncbi:MAG: putative ABC-type ATPase [Gammaproteobacteria bacterium]|jgi:predicted ABC-type ATPase
MPVCVLIGGCNGAGKTTFARQFLPARYPGMLFLNADEISREGRVLENPVAAGRELLARLDKAIAGRSDVAIETTLSSRMYARRIAD